MAQSKSLDDYLTEFIEAKEEDIVHAREELKQLEEDELTLQRQKQQLLAIHKNLGSIFKLNQDKLDHCRAGLTQIQTNIFDQIHPIVSDIHHQELLVLELTQELQRQQIANDVGYICSKINEDSRLHVEETEPLWNWYREMREYDQAFKSSRAVRTTDDGEIPDCHFFYPSYKDLNGRVQLTFSSRYKNACVHMNISRDSSIPPEESYLTYKVSADMAMDGLELEANRTLLRKGCTAQQFVEDIVWPLLGDLG